MLAVTLRQDPFANIRSLPLVGPALADAAAALKAGAEQELKRRLTPWFAAALGLGALGVVLGVVAVVRTRKARR